jgi:hypothetical protein
MKRKYPYDTLCLNCNHMQSQHWYSDPISGLWAGECWKCKKFYGFTKCYEFEYSNLKYLQQKYESSL